MPKYIGKRVTKAQWKDAHGSKLTRYRQKNYVGAHARTRATSTLLAKVAYVSLPFVFVTGPIAGDNDFTYSAGFSRFDFEKLPAASTTVFGINSTPLWDRIRPLFEEYAVTGFKLEFIPSN